MTSGDGVAAADPADGTGTSGGAAEGGGAYVVGAISIESGAIAQNRALAGKGGDGSTPGDGGIARGGGIAQRASSTAAVAIEGASLAGNLAEGGSSGYTDQFNESAFTGKGTGGDALGGAIAAAGTLTATEVMATQNTARGGASGLGSARARGGALYTSGGATLQAGTFSENRGEGGAGFWMCYYRQGCWGGLLQESGGGGVWAAGDLHAVGGRYSSNVIASGSGMIRTGSDASGGALASAGTVTIERGEYTGNQAGPSSDGAASGGAVSGQTVKVSSAAFTNNSAVGHGGAIAAATLDMTDVMASQNKADGFGGGAVAVSGDATILRSKLNQNVVASSNPRRTVTGGGAISVLGKLTVSDSEVVGNRGAITVTVIAGTNLILTLNGVFQGGGIRAGSVVATDTTVADNIATGVTLTQSMDVQRSLPFPAGTTGGGAIAATGSVTLLNTTLTGNQVSAGQPATTLAAQGAPARRRSTSTFRPS